MSLHEVFLLHTPAVQVDRGEGRDIIVACVSRRNKFAWTHALKHRGYAQQVNFGYRFEKTGDRTNASQSDEGCICSRKD